MTLSHLENRLIQESLVTAAQLEKIAQTRKKERKSVVELIVDHGYVKEEDIAGFLSREYNLPFIRPEDNRLQPIPEENLEELIPYEFAARHNVLALCRNISSVTVAAFDPTDQELVATLESLAGCGIKLIVAARSSLQKAIKEFYGKNS